MFLDKIAFMTPAQFFEGLSGQLGLNSAQMIMDAYKMTVDMDQNLFLNAAMRWMGDVAFDGECKYKTLEALHFCIRKVPLLTFVEHLRMRLPNT